MAYKSVQAIANSHLETEKNLKGSVLPILGRLHAELKHKAKELSSGAVKGSKSVDKARNVTQKHIELLGQHTGGFPSSGGKVDSSNDPYVLQRGVNHRLHKQVIEENNNRHDLLAVQDSFQQFEAHVIQTIQQAMSAFLQNVGGQAERQKALYTDMVATTQHIPLDFEWKGFVHRNGSLLIDPSTPKRDISRISFPNQDHASTRPLIAGTLERKSRAALKGYSTGYYVVTPSKYLHQFADNDDVRKDPTPDISLYLPDCTIGATNGVQFNVKGKDASKGKVGGALALNHEFAFKAHTPADAEKWSSIIREAAGPGNYTGEFSGSAPASPVESRNFSSHNNPAPPYQEQAYVAPVQTQGLPQGHSGTAPNSAVQAQQSYHTPVSAGGLHSGASPATGRPPAPSGAERAPGHY